MQKREGGGGVYYLVASAVGPNYSYAFLTILQRFQTFFDKNYSLHFSPTVTLLVTLIEPTNLFVTSMKLLQMS